jgi:hypothetical protein
MNFRSCKGAVLLIPFVLGAGALTQAAREDAGPAISSSQMRPIFAARSNQAKNLPHAELLVSVIVTWLAANFDLPAMNDHVSIKLAPPPQIAALRYGVSGTDGGRHVLGVYVDRTRTIYLPEDWTGRSPAETSVLVHELVHYLQHLDMRAYDCPEAREKLAYAAQEKWLGLFGRSLLQDFEIDAMTLKVVTACM